MTTLNKILIALLALTIVGAIGFIIYQQHEMSTMQTQINNSIVAQKTLLDGITRSSSQYATQADLAAFAAQNNVSLATIQKDVETLGATITGMNQVVVNSSGENVNNTPSSSTTPNTSPQVAPTVTCDGQQIPCPNADPFKYQQNQQNLALNENFGPTPVPIGTVGFSAWQQNPWNATIYPRTYDVSNVLATDQDGKQYVYNQVSITTNNKTYTVPISTSKFEQQYPTPAFSFWNPRIYLGADAGINVSHVPMTGEVTPNVSFGFVSYGKSKVNPDLSIMQVGVGYGVVSQKAQIQIAPIQYNIGKNLPFMQNTYIGPTLGIGVDGDVNIGVGLRVGM